jgi:hypothetical protein
MPAFICVACGGQYANSEAPPQHCVICLEDRRPATGSNWTTMEDLRQTHFNAFRRLEPGLMGIGTMPGFGLRQRAILLRTGQGNILWDCTSLLDDATVAIVTALGGISAIAVSHPHAYSTMIAWSHAFGSPPVYAHVRDRRQLPRFDAVLEFWDKDALELTPGLTLLRCGGASAGASVLHWQQGSNGQGTLLTGATLSITRDRGFGFMRSVANQIPLDAASALRISEVLAPWPFEAAYGLGWEPSIAAEGSKILAQSAQRHAAAVGEASESY